jgi:hypothetical protein
MDGELLNMNHTASAGAAAGRYFRVQTETKKVNGQNQIPYNILRYLPDVLITMITVYRKFSFFVLDFRASGFP